LSGHSINVLVLQLCLACSNEPLSYSEQGTARSEEVDGSCFVAYVLPYVQYLKHHQRLTSTMNEEEDLAVLIYKSSKTAKQGGCCSSCQGEGRDECSF